MKFLDANVFLRFLTRDDEMKAQACSRLFERLEKGEEEATTCEAVIAEVVYLLGLRTRNAYGLPPDEIARRLRPLLILRGLHLDDRAIYLAALDVYEAHRGIDFEDAVIVAHMRRRQVDELLSYDRDFDAVPGVRRVEP